MALFDRDNHDSNRPNNALARITKGAAIAIALAIAIGTTGLAFAHGPGHGGHSKMERWKNMSTDEKKQKMEQRLERRLQKMTEHLELSDSQQAEIREIMERGQAEALEVFENADEGERGELRKKLHRIRKDRRSEVKAVLTDEQIEKIAEHRRERHERRPERMMQRLDARLDLDDTQEKQVEAILSEAQQDIKQLRDQIDEDDRDPEQFKQHRRAVRNIMKGAADDIASVLDDEQAAEFRELRKEFRERRGR